MKKIRGDKPIGVIKTYTQTPCLATFISNKQKCHSFLFFPFLSYKIREQESRTGPEGSLGGGTSGRGEVAGIQVRG
jgi:hypothetical protein